MDPTPPFKGTPTVQIEVLFGLLGPARAPEPCSLAASRTADSFGVSFQLGSAVIRGGSGLGPGFRKGPASCRFSFFLLSDISAR